MGKWGGAVVVFIQYRKKPCFCTSFPESVNKVFSEKFSETCAKNIDNMRMKKNAKKSPPPHPIYKLKGHKNNFL